LKKTDAKKIIVLIIITLLIGTFLVPAFNALIVIRYEGETGLKTCKHGIVKGKLGAGYGWYWKPPYPNYAPSGMPDFSQKDNAGWKAIFPGPNGKLDSTPHMDDVISSDGLRIAPGPNCHLDSQASGDDVIDWCFCGPVAVANCLWWFDSKYSNPKGNPGDGKDIFPLVKDYGGGDDHSYLNVDYLVEKLALKMKTCTEGLTYADDMQKALDSWFKETNLSQAFEEKTYNKPTFSFVEDEIERSQDVILLLGFYDAETGEKAVDQKQTQFNQAEEIPAEPQILWQMFFPSVTKLDAIQVVLSGSLSDTITAWIFDSQWKTLGKTSMTLQPNPQPMWYQFHFNQSIPLTPGLTYYISLSGKNYNWLWHFWLGPPDNYDGVNTSSLPGPEDDFTFKTEYYVTPPQCIRKGGHFVTCAGVNSEEQKIAFSDPAKDVQNPSPNDHRNAKYVSHDIYNVSIGSPCPSLDYKWWLPDYQSGYDYTIVEKAVIICPKPHIDVDKKVWDKDKWNDETTAKAGDIIRFKIIVHNDGGTELRNIVVTDTLPNCLSYANNATPQEPETDGNKLTWRFSNLKPFEKIEIQFDAKALLVGQNVNKVEVEAPGELYDSDTATVIVQEKPRPDLECEGSLSWSNVKPGSTVTGSFIVKNVGDPGSELDWEIYDYPTWGRWTFNPSSGNNLKPEDGEVTVEVTVTAPSEKNKQFTGEVKVKNKENSSDYCTIPISLATPKSIQQSSFAPTWAKNMPLYRFILYLKNNFIFL